MKSLEILLAVLNLYEPTKKFWFDLKPKLQAWWKQLKKAWEKIHK